MHAYKRTESQDGSHFFIQTPNECRYLFEISKTEEEYFEEFLDDHIYNTFISRFTLNLKPTFIETEELCKTIRHIVFNYASNNDVVIKIEVDKDHSRTNLIQKYFNQKPDHIDGLTHVVNGSRVYYFFSSLRINSTSLIASLVKEFNTEDNTDK